MFYRAHVSPVSNNSQVAQGPHSAQRTRKQACGRVGGRFVRPPLIVAGRAANLGAVSLGLPLRLAPPGVTTRQTLVAAWLLRLVVSTEEAQGAAWDYAPLQLLHGELIRLGPIKTQASKSQHGAKGVAGARSHQNGLRERRVPRISWDHYCLYSETYQA